MIVIRVVEVTYRVIHWLKTPTSSGDILTPAYPCKASAKTIFCDYNVPVLQWLYKYD